MNIKKTALVGALIPFAGKYTIVNADNGFVYGSYNEQDFFEHGTIVK